MYETPNRYSIDGYHYKLYSILFEQIKNILLYFNYNIMWVLCVG